MFPSFDRREDDELSSSVRARFLGGSLVDISREEECSRGGDDRGAIVVDLIGPKSAYDSIWRDMVRIKNPSTAGA